MTMATIFCCSSISPYRPRPLDHDDKFATFMRWTTSHKPSADVNDDFSTTVETAPYAVQLVRQVNFGPQESIRYFVPAIGGSHFTETTEDSLIKSNFEKLNSYKNFRCSAHNKFFEVNLYQKNPINRHHWRSTLARPSRDIDLAFRRQEVEAESSKKAGELAAEQERKQEITASDKNNVFPELHKSLLPALEEADGTKYKEIESSNRIDMAILKSALRFILPTLGKSRGSNNLISLLCLDWVSTELNLGLKFEDLWEAEINSSKIILFFVDCFAVDDAFVNLGVDLAEVEDLVIPAIRYVDSQKGEQAVGKLRLHKIVKRVLESGRNLDWVSAYGGSILRVFTSGPSEKLLDHCRRKNEEICEHNLEKDKERFALYGDQDDNEDDGAEFHYDGSESEYESMKDFTACDKECGYCGHCDY